MLLFLERMGAAVCHQMEGRSLSWGTGTLPLCARCTGIYLGAFLAFCFFFLRKRMQGSRPFSWGQMGLLLCAVLPLAVDGVGSYLGFWQSNGLLRILTGSLLGAALPGFFLLAGNFDPTAEKGTPIFQKTKELVCLLLGAVCLGLLLLQTEALRSLGAVCSILGEVLFWAGVLWLILRSLFPKRQLPLWQGAVLLSFCFLYAVGGWLQ